MKYNTPMNYLVWNGQTNQWTLERMTPAGYLQMKSEGYIVRNGILDASPPTNDEIDLAITAANANRHIAIPEIHKDEIGKGYDY